MTAQMFRRLVVRTLAAICMFAMAGQSAATAGTMIQPVSGTTYNLAFPFTVKWSGIPSPGTPVGFELTASANSTITVPLSGIPNTGQYTFTTADRNMVCKTIPQAVSIGVYPWSNLGSNTSVPQSQISWQLKVVNSSGSAIVSSFKFKCPPDGPLQHGTGGGALNFVKGSLTLTKVVVNTAPPALAPPSTAFQVNVSCGGGAATVVTLNAANNFRQTLSNLVSEASCTVSEVPPPVPPDLFRRGCGWTTSYPDGTSVAIVAGQTADRRVVNTWSCKGTGGGSGGGTTGSGDAKERAQ